jgi:hypothetical protein
MVKKRREEVKQIVYERKYMGNSADEEIRLNMKDISHLTPLTHITLKFYE